MQLPKFSPPAGAAVVLLPRVLERAGGAAVTDDLAHKTKARVADQLATAVDTTEMRRLFDELERDDPDQYWSSGKARAEAFGVRDRAVVGMLALASGWETSEAMEGASRPVPPSERGRLVRIGEREHRAPARRSG